MTSSNLIPDSSSRPSAHPTDEHFDVVVVGGGNAALCAAISAAESGASVVVLERAPRAERGGNSAFTAGAMRVAYDDVQDVLDIVEELSPEQIRETDFGTYTQEQFLDDLGRVTEYRTDPDLAEIIVNDSYATLLWMKKHGIRFAPIYGRQAFKVDGRFTFWGGLTIETIGGGQGLVDGLTAECERLGITIRYGCRATSLVRDGDRVCGVNYRSEGKVSEISCGAAVMAAGGFQANSAMRAQYLGPGWDLAKVRGTRFNTGDGIRMAMDVGAAPWGHWSGCHAVGWEYSAPPFGDLRIGDSFQKHSYPFSIMLNADGKRFLDEGADFRNYTYAKYGKRILEQPGQFAWQIFDGSLLHLLRDEYRIREVTKITANTIEQLVTKLEGVDSEQALRTINDFNAAIDTEQPFNPNVKDGRRTTTLEVDKTNWAVGLHEPPFHAYRVTCGITFTFGGLHIGPDASVLDEDTQAIPGLFACGELVGGIFYFNYPGGSGLTAGAVFGRRSGRAAAQAALTARSGASDVLTA
ncbi:FAD-dependent tricarballylate dehydrogenase TcuA [Glaciibacter superstes]|uniref:FAD-dependent tricarballylate dehydrogenase TcuA n=1 Tax=Glaciibacter superstes TaxID=501023 RepID=UPI0003B5404F|nr:FAD-dependent tricarballylate dehydrogenase TcuA [Glaciibacter superstes]